MGMLVSIGRTLYGVIDIKTDAPSAVKILSHNKQNAFRRWTMLQVFSNKDRRGYPCSKTSCNFERIKIMNKELHTISPKTLAYFVVWLRNITRAFTQP